MAYTITTDWDAIQERNIDIETPVHSDNHNKLLKILGSHKAYITGLDISFERDATNNKMIAHFTKGIGVISYMGIELLQSSTIELFSCPCSAITICVVMDYNYSRIPPRAVASIKVINANDYDPTRHLKLYTYKLGAWSIVPTLAEWNTWIGTPPNFVDNRFGVDSIPEWARRTFVLKRGDTMLGQLLLHSSTPTNALEAASKAYVDTSISSHDTQHDDRYVRLSGSTMTGFLTLSANPTSNLHAATKQYVDAFVSTHDHDGSYLKLTGGTLTGLLTLSGNPTSNLHAAPKQYVDTKATDVLTTVDSTYLKLSGGSMTGRITMSLAPTDDNHVVNKSYVDTHAANLFKALNTTPSETDWNDVAEPGTNNLTQGTYTNGPGGSWLYPVAFGYGNNRVQLAIPYNANTAANSKISFRTKYSDTWTNWIALVNETRQIKAGAGIASTSEGTLENDITITLGTPSSCSTTSTSSVTGTTHTHQIVGFSPTHNHPYLPLTGGTVTGDIDLNEESTSNPGQLRLNGKGFLYGSAGTTNAVYLNSNSILYLYSGSTWAETTRIDVRNDAKRIDFIMDGTTRAQVTTNGLVGALYNADVVEFFEHNMKNMPRQGQCVVLQDDGKVVVSTSDANPNVLGFVSYSPGLILGGTGDFEAEFVRGKISVALLGQIQDVVINSKQARPAGTLLVSAPDGRVQPKDDVNGQAGSVIAKALKPIPAGSSQQKIVIFTA